MSSSPSEVESVVTQRNKQTKMNTRSGRVQVDEVFDASSSADEGATNISLNDLHKLIRKDILKASDQTNARINEISVQIKQSVSKLEDEMESIKTSQQFISDEFEAVKTSIAGQKEDIVSLKNELKTVKAECITTQHNLEELNFELNALKQTNLDGHLLISNVIKAAEENLGHLLQSIFTMLNINCSAEDILSVKRLSSTNQTGIHPILVCFSSLTMKEKIMKAARQRPINCDEIGLGVSQRIYFNHHLTPANQRLLGAARKYKRQHNFMFVWYANGGIFLRKDANSRAFKVNDIRDLNGSN